MSLWSLLIYARDEQTITRGLQIRQFATEQEAFNAFVQEINKLDLWPDQAQRMIASMSMHRYAAFPDIEYEIRELIINR